MNRPRDGLLASEEGPAWLRVVFTGLLLYVAGIAVLLVTGNPNLFPTIVILGNFLVPVAYVVFFFEHGHLDQGRLPTTALTFVVGGVLGVFAAALLEPLFIRRLDILTAFAVGLTEEFAKILGLLAVVRRARFTTAMDGLIFDAAAGMGFAALESSGYAFSAFLRTGGSLSFTVGLTRWVSSLPSSLSRRAAAGLARGPGYSQAETGRPRRRGRWPGPRRAATRRPCRPGTAGTTPAGISP